MANIVWRCRYCGGSFEGWVMAKSQVAPGEDITPHILTEFARRGIPGPIGEIMILGIDNYRSDIEAWSGKPSDKDSTFRDDFEERQRERQRQENLELALQGNFT